MFRSESKTRGFLKSREWRGEDEPITREFLKITKEELEMLQGRIDRVRGHVRVSVHALYVGRTPEDFFSGYEKQRSLPQVDSLMSEGFSRNIKGTIKNKRSSPLFILEGNHLFEETKRRVAKSNGLDVAALAKKGILFLPTEYESGELFGEAISEAYKNAGELEAARIASLQRKESQTRKFKRDVAMFRILSAILGIHSATISGAHFSRSNERLFGCAGMVTEALRTAGILVDISRFSWADPEQLRVKGHITKETGK